MGAERLDFEAYVAARGQSLLRFAYVLAGDPHLAEDLTQTALADAYRHWRRVSRAEHPDAYVRRMLVNAHLTWRRRRSSAEQPARAADAAAVLPDEDRHAVADPAAAYAERDSLRRALATLPVRARTVLALRYYADLDDRAIADLMGISDSAVRSTASRALATLRADLPGVSDAPPPRPDAPDAPSSPVAPALEETP